MHLRFWLKMWQRYHPQIDELIVVTAGGYHAGSVCAGAEHRTAILNSFLSLHVCAAWASETYLKKAVELVLMLVCHLQQFVEGLCIRHLSLSLSPSYLFNFHVWYMICEASYCKVEPISKHTRRMISKETICIRHI